MIEKKDLTRRFGDFTAVNHLDLTIRAGAFFGLPGPRGAGKTAAVSVVSAALGPAESKEAFGVQPCFYETGAGVRCYVKP